MVRYDLAERYMDLAQNNLLSAYNSVKEFLRNQTLDVTLCDYRENLIIASPDRYSDNEIQAFKAVFQQGITSALTALLEIKGFTLKTSNLEEAIRFVDLHYSNNVLSSFLKKYVTHGSFKLIELNDFQTLYELLEDVKTFRRESGYLFNGELEFAAEIT